MEGRGLCVGAGFAPWQLGVSLSCVCGLVSWLCSGMLGESGSGGHAALPGFRKRKGPEELFAFGEAFEVTEGLSCLVEGRGLCLWPVEQCGPRTFGKAGGRKGAPCHFVGTCGDSDWSWGVQWPFPPAPASRSPSLLWGTSVFPLWVSPGHLTLWALMRGLR